MKEEGRDLWTFDPPCGREYESVDPRVVLVGGEPNGENLHGERHDMGDWFNTALDHDAWENRRSRQFLERSLLYVEAIVLPHAEGLWANWRQRKAEVRERLLRHLRFVDLKAEEGDGAADVHEVLNWVDQHTQTVEGLFIVPPAQIIIVLGRTAQKVFDKLVRPRLCDLLPGSMWAGMPHPSAQEVVPVNGAKQLRNHLLPITERGWRWIESAQNWWPVDLA